VIFGIILQEMAVGGILKDQGLFLDEYAGVGWIWNQNEVEREFRGGEVQRKSSLISSFPLVP
jgi:hypothetical protein